MNQDSHPYEELEHLLGEKVYEPYLLNKET